MTPEGKVKRKITECLKRMNAYYFYPATHGYGSSGVLDIVICYKGRFVGIEVKADAKRNPPTALQMDNLKRIENNGGVAWVIDASNVAELEEKLEML